MKVILRSTDLSFIQSAQVALDAQDIPAVVIGENATGLPSSPTTLAVVQDEDFERATTILRGLTQTEPQPWRESSGAQRALLLVLVVLVLVLCGLLIF